MKQKEILINHQSNIRQLFADLFRDDSGEPFKLTDGQVEIVRMILFKQHPRCAINATTQYGKSDVVAMSVLLRSILFKEKFIIVAGRKDKAQIIMGRVVQHTFDHPLLYSQLEIDSNIPLERLKRERSKDNIIWKGGGGVRSLTAGISSRKNVEDSLTGFGSQNVIEDESALIPDDFQSMVLRMIAGQKDSFLLKIGNPFHKNHFYKSMNSSKYKTLKIDYRQAIAEGRYSEEFIEEARELPFFDILYGCEFPEEEGQIDGWIKLFPDELVLDAMVDEMPDNEVRLGVDFAGSGRDQSAYVIRGSTTAQVVEVNDLSDTMQQVPIVRRLKDRYGIDDKDISLDYGGLGQGIGDRLQETDVYANLIMFGQSAENKDRFKNMRAEMYFNLRNWLKNGGKLVKHEKWNELSWIYFKEDSSGKFKLMPKEEIRRNVSGARSPDVPDALALTFSPNNITDSDDIEFL